MAINWYSRFDAGRNTRDRASPQALCTNVHPPDEHISYNVPLFINEMLIVSSIVRKILYTLFSKAEILKFELAWIKPIVMTKYFKFKDFFRGWCLRKKEIYSLIVREEMYSLKWSILEEIVVIEPNLRKPRTPFCINRLRCRSRKSGRPLGLKPAFCA